MSNNVVNFFVVKFSFSCMVEKGLFWIFCFVIYVVLFCGVFVFGDIFIKGLCMVFKSEFFFVNMIFFM